MVSLFMRQPHFSFPFTHFPSVAASMRQYAFLTRVIFLFFLFASGTSVVYCPPSPKYMKNKTHNRHQAFGPGAAVAAGLIFFGAMMAPTPVVAAYVLQDNPAPVDLGSAYGFAVLSYAAITTGAPATYSGNIGSKTAAVNIAADNLIKGNLYSGAPVNVGADTTVNGNLHALTSIGIGAGAIIYGGEQAGTTVGNGANVTIFGSIQAGSTITNAAGVVVHGTQVPNSAPQPPTALLNLALDDAVLAFNDLNGRTSQRLDSLQLGGLTWTRGVYDGLGAVDVTGVATFDAQNDPNAIFIIRSSGAMTTAAGSSMGLINGAQAKNIYFVPNGSATTGADSLLLGNILASGGITYGAGAGSEGRIFSTTGAITFGAGKAGLNFGLSEIAVSPIPEPSSVGQVLGLGLIVFAAIRRRRSGN